MEATWKSPPSSRKILPCHCTMENQEEEVIHIILKKIECTGSVFSRIKNEIRKKCKKKKGKTVDIVLNVKIETMEELDEIKRFLQGLD